MAKEQGIYYLLLEEPVKSGLLVLRDLILSNAKIVDE